MHYKNFPMNTLAEWHEPPILALDDLGNIKDYNKSCEQLFNCQSRNLVGRHISSLLPQLSGVELVQKGQANPLLKYGCRCGRHFQAQDVQGHAFPCKLSIIFLKNDGRHTLRLMVHPLDDVQV